MDNLSSISEYDNVPFQSDNFSQSDVYQTINDLLNINGDVETIVFCPLCVYTFEYKFSLFEHLRTIHHNFLIKVSNKVLNFKECPFCNAKFYGEHLTAKHTLLHHSKVIRELFVDAYSRCSFCGNYLNPMDCSDTIKHIKEMHFIDFEEEFKKKFSTTISEMTFSEFINSTIGNNKTPATSGVWNNICVNVRNTDSGEAQLLSSSAIDFKDASKINCFDFADLKKQLQNIKNCYTINKESTAHKQKSVLRTIQNSPMQKSVRRVLRFDLSDVSDDNNKNSKLNKILKQDSIKEHSLLYNDEINKENLGNLTDHWYNTPKHSSTPNFNTYKSKGKILGKNNLYFKSYSCLENHLEFEFQCGKCRQLFKENLELVSHIKKTHKKFDLKVFKPRYRCGICNATFFKNYYLLKHHRLHNPY